MTTNQWTIPVDVLKVAGDQTGWYLDGQLSISVSDLQDGLLKTGMLLNPDGTLVAPVGVVKEGGCTWLYSPKGSVDAVLERLMRFKLRSKVVFEQAGGSAAGLYGITADDIKVRLNDIQDKGFGWICSDITKVGDIYRVEMFRPIAGDELDESDRRPSEHEEEIARSIAGQPRWAAEIFPGMNPMELGSSYVRSHADFTKGCYTGQELIERVDSRGYNTPRHLSGFIVRGSSNECLSQIERVVERDGKQVFSISSLFSYPGTNCQIGMGFVHRIGGEFLDRYTAGSLEFTMVEPGAVLSALNEI